MDRHHSHQRALRLAVIAMLLFSGIELGFGLLFSGTSLTLEATHNAIDVACYMAVLLATRHNQPLLTRVSSGVLVFSAVPFLTYGALDLQSPHVEHPWVVLGMSILGFVVNLWLTNKLHPFRESLHEVAGLLHAVGDVAASVVAVLGYVVVVAWGANAADPIAAIFGALIVVVVNTIALILPDKHSHNHEHGAKG